MSLRLRYRAPDSVFDQNRILIPAFNPGIKLKSRFEVKYLSKKRTYRGLCNYKFLSAGLNNTQLLVSCSGRLVGSAIESFVQHCNI